MTYQEIIENYPCINTAWEVFKGISPSILGILTVLVTQHCIKKRELQYKKKEMRLEYLEKILNWLHQVKVSMFEVASMLDKALAENNPEIRREKCNEVIKELNDMNLSIATWADTYSSVTTAFKCDIKLKQFKESACFFGDEMIVILEKYIREPDTSNATDEINSQTKQVMEAFDLSVTLLAKKINSLYKR